MVRLSSGVYSFLRNHGRNHGVWLKGQTIVDRGIRTLIEDWIKEHEPEYAELMLKELDA